MSGIRCQVSGAGAWWETFSRFGVVRGYGKNFHRIMRKIATKLTTVACVIAAAATQMTGCSQDEKYLEGQGQAKRDLGRGEFMVAIADGTNMPAFVEYTDLLQKRYHVGWVVSTPSWVRGYNEVAGPEVERQVGVQVLKQTLLDAQSMHAGTNASH